MLFQSMLFQITALNRREISSVELVQAYLEHNRQLAPHLNALVQVAADRALAEAQAADESRAQGNLVSPLHGIPFTAKDSWETVGIVSASGTLGRKSYLPHQDATIVKRLRDAGAILLGKTNCPELVMPFETDNIVYGRTNNPWDLSRTPGGSTGGEAALIAAGGSPLGIAGDAGASIRTPSHFCGITGIKPTTGRVPRTGHFPQMGGATGAMASAGPMARTVDDLALVLPFLVGGDGLDPASVPMPYFPPAEVEISELRVAFYVDNGIMPADAETAQAVYQAAQALERLGASITEAKPAGMDATIVIFDGLFGGDGGSRITAFLEKIGTTEISDPLQRILKRQAQSPISTAELMTLLGRADKFRAQVLAFMQNYDLILCPVAAYPAPKHDSLLDAEGGLPLSYTMTYNLTGYPSASVPVMLSAEGLPIGVQVIAESWREDRVLAAAKIIEQSFGGYQKPGMPFLANSSL